MIFESNIQSAIFELFSKITSCLEIKLDSFKKDPNIHNFSKLTLTPKIIVCIDSEVDLVFNAVAAFNAMKSLPPPLLMPDIRVSAFDSIKTFYEEFRELFGMLSIWYENEQILIFPLHTILYYLPSSDLLKGFTLSFAQTINLNNLCSNLLNCGYESVDIIEMQGEFSLRGDILDIFISREEVPVRLSFFDTQIESIRYFDISTQLSYKDELESIIVTPALFYLNEKDFQIIESKINELDNHFEKNINSLGFWFLKDIGGINFLKQYPCVFTFEALKDYVEMNLENDFKLDTLNVIGQSTIFKDFTLHLKDMQNFLNLNKHKKINLLSNLPENKLCDNINENTNLISIPYFLNIASKNEIFVSLNTIAKKTKKRVGLEIDSLRPNEYVIHIEYGVGIFENIQKINVLGGLKDFISILYANEARLLLPIENMNLIERYVNFDSNIKLDRLGKSSFVKIKESIKHELLDIANEIIKLQAERKLNPGLKLTLKNEHKDFYRQFQESRGFNLTIDQEEAINESLNDLSSSYVMDRLLSGDVGFGKTEVAMNLCAVCFLNGYVSIIVVPTMILAMQHFENFKFRFANLKYNDRAVRITKLDKLSTSNEKKYLVDAMKNKEVDIIIATHSIFNLEVSNLGLLIIDEEHKFGVKQKEMLKSKSIQTHVLSMSATPIPRTLNMVFSKIKSVSELKIPPINKQEVKTFLKLKSDALIKEIILRELRRGGQVFYIFNNIARISIVNKYLKTLLPNLRILILHSEINSKDIENGMIDFAFRKYDLLLCTSIVQSGIHVPNANTIIIDDAHNFGIATLHQLRGRVGRGKHLGFCYLLSKIDIGDSAKKRLLALEKNSFLGSGIALSQNDLEIRGSGNLLGISQSGHIKHVGFGLYIRMLEDTLKELSSTKESKIDLKLSISAFLNEELIVLPSFRIELYRRLSLTSNISSVERIKSEIEDRFGKIDNYTNAFLELIKIKIKSIKVGIKSIMNFNEKITFDYADGRRIYENALGFEDELLIAKIFEHLDNALKLIKISDIDKRIVNEEI